MKKNIQRREALKTMAAAGGLLLLNTPAFAGGQRLVQSFNKVNKSKSLSGGWLCQGQSCVIYQEGMKLILVDQYNNVATANLGDDRTFTVSAYSGTGWTVNWAGALTAQVAADNNSIVWGDGAVWERDPALMSRPAPNITGGWIYKGGEIYNEQCAVHQQGTLALFCALSITGFGLWIGNSSFVIFSSGGQEGLFVQVSPDAKTLNWSNGTAWVRDTALVRA